MINIEKRIILFTNNLLISKCRLSQSVLREAVIRFNFIILGNLLKLYRNQLYF